MIAKHFVEVGLLKETKKNTKKKSKRRGGQTKAYFLMTFTDLRLLLFLLLLSQLLLQLLLYCHYCHCHQHPHPSRPPRIEIAQNKELDLTRKEKKTQHEMNLIPLSSAKHFKFSALGRLRAVKIQGAVAVAYAELKKRLAQSSPFIAVHRFHVSFWIPSLFSF